jgi:DNA end-binding protein Ku
MATGKKPAKRTSAPRMKSATKKSASKKSASKESAAKKSGPSARAIWKGVLNFGSVRVPVKLYSAVQGRGVHFRLLHAKDEAPVRQQMVNPETGEVVPQERVAKGFVDEGGVVVKLSDEELEELEPAASRDIEVMRFVKPAAIDHLWYDRPYFLGPDEDADEDYFALAAALVRTERDGVARWVMRNKEYVGALRVRGDHLMLITMRHAGEVVPATALEPPAGRPIEKKELALAEQLVAAMEDTFDPSLYRDEWRERVLEFVEAKAKGHAPKVQKLTPRKTDTKDLAGVLEASLKSARKERKSA